MPFLGKTPAQGFVNSVTKDDFTPNGSTTAFTLSKTPATVNEIEVYVGNVRQEPTSAYSVSGATLTMTEAPATGTNFYVMHIGGTTQSSTTPPGGSTVPGDFNVSGDSTVLGQIAIGTTTLNRDIHISTARPDIRLTDTTDNSYSEIVYNVGKLSVQVDPDQTNSNDSAFLVKTDDTTRIRVDSNGLLFGSDTAAANALDDYEEGTFTPTLISSTGTISYTLQLGWYRKVGSLVFIAVDVVASNTANAILESLANFPFTVGSTSGFYPGPAIANAYNINLGTGGTALGGYWVNGETRMRFHTYGNNTGQLTPSISSSGTFEIRMTGFFSI